jgi:dimeric dUTPase (all-alpha-NTP-PPase superfamily)
VSHLEEIFQLQRALNERVLDRLRDPSADSRLTLPGDLPSDADFTQAPDATRAKWWRNYITAMMHEAAEALNSLPWKWWAEDEQLINLMLHNARIELIDILHFWVSACLALGLEPDLVTKIYRQKNAVNMERQDAHYTHEGKSEDDNLNIDTGIDVSMYRKSKPI